MINKIGRYSWRDLYLLPLALMLWPMVKVNYMLREKGLLKDEWFWADRILLEIGYWL